MNVYLLTTGDGSYGSEWNLVSIHSTRKLAETAKTDYEAERIAPGGIHYHYQANIEEWPVDGMNV